MCARTSAAQPSGSVVTRPAESAAPPAVAAPAVRAPVLLRDEGAEYPAQAVAEHVTEPVEVVVTLELDAHGAVTAASIDTPQGRGFDEAALAAARRLEFEPAMRGDRPVAAKIRHAYRFTPPPSRLIGRISAQLTGAPLSGVRVSVGGSGGQYVVMSGSDGTFVVEGVAPGSYHVAVEAPGYSTEQYDEDMSPAEEARLEIRLSRAVATSLPVEPEIEEVQVLGEKPPREVTKRTLEQRELSRIPGTNGDALRGIQNLPGVARPPGLAGLLIVRGAAPNETSVYVDGTLIPLVYHFGGLTSVIPTEMLDKIDFYPGNFSSYYGRVTGAIVDVGVHDPRADNDGRLHGLAQADLIDARVLAQGPVFDTGWKFAVAGRRSYVDLWLGPVLEKAGVNVTTAPVYYDYQLMLARDWDHGKHHVRFFFFGSDDRLSLLVKNPSGDDPGVGGDLTLGTSFYRFQARYVGKFGDSTELRLTAGVGQDQVSFNLGDNLFSLKSHPVNPRVELSQRLVSGARNNLGLDILYSPFEVNVRLPPLPRPGEPPPGPFGSRQPLQTSTTDALYRPAIYDELELTPFSGTRIVPGVRLDYAKDTRGWEVQPRLVVRQELTSAFPKTTLKGGIGRFAQPPEPRQTNAVFGIPGLQSNIANHYGLGVEREFTRQIEASVEGFYRQYDHLVTERVGNVGEGRAFGIETLIRYRPDARFFGFIAYTLSRSVRKDLPSEPEHLFQYDQTHIFTAVGSYRLGRGWELGARFRAISGSPTTPNTYGFYDATIGSYIPSAQFPPFGSRAALFNQLDLRVDKTWAHAWGKMSAYLDIINVYNQANVEGVYYNFNYTQSSNATGLPFLPSLGLRAEF